MAKLDYLSLEIKVQNETVLVILIHNDGTINRKGDGSHNPGGPFVMGMGDTNEIFKKLRPLVTPDFESYLGNIYDISEKKGKECSLDISLGIDSKISGCRFIYGADSMGPPKPVADFVTKSLEVTDSWYLQANKNAEMSSEKNGKSRARKVIGKKELMGFLSVTGVILVLIFHEKILKTIREASNNNVFIAISAGLVFFLYIISAVIRNIKK